MPIYSAAPPSLWTGRNAETIQYWHQAVTCLSSSEIPIDVEGKKVAFLGYQGEEGVKRNQGRIGTAQGPDLVRKIMGSMAYHLSETTRIFDLGNFRIEGDQMEETHDLLYATIKKLLSQKVFPIVIGGGHDLAYPHGSAALAHCSEKKEKLGIINLDAHFDLRPLLEGRGHSGSPFFQLGENHPKDFHYLCLGIQRAANPPILFETAKRLKAEWMEIEDFTLENWEEITLLLDEFCSKVNKIYLSIDLDGFSSAYAPGVSAPSPLGFSPELAFKVLDWIAKTGKLISMDVVELNPNYDQDNSTARLAARCVEFVLRKLS